VKEPLGKWKLKEGHIGKFERSCTVPWKVKREDMKTSIEDGVYFLLPFPRIIRLRNGKRRSG